MKSVFLFTASSKEAQVNLDRTLKKGIPIEYLEPYLAADVVSLLTDSYKNGQMAFERNYKQGNLDGTFIEWYENGQKSSEGN